MEHVGCSKSAPIQAIVIPHLLWSAKEFSRQPPTEPPTVEVEISIMYRAHTSFGRNWHGRTVPRTTVIVACADTRTQTCSSGPEILALLNCPEQYLIPTSHKIRGITNSHLELMGALLLHIRIGCHETRQVMYVSRNTSGVYLSESTLKDLHIIPKNFPHTDSKSASTIPTSPISADITQRAPCGCPLRTTVPDRPTILPFPPTADNREKLEHWILAHFSSSAFNTCPHQRLQTMTGKPLDIVFKADTIPSAVHCPIPVPHHWKKEVKAALDRDEDMGIIEPVPQGTPTTWCSRMVVAPKKDGSARRTVDLQKLNAATLRETSYAHTV